MTSFRGLDELWRRALELNLRYYSSVGKLSAEYLRDLAVAMSSAQTAATAPGTSTAPPGAAPSAGSGDAAASQKSTAQPAVMVLEAESGSSALGVFLVGNSMTGEVSATIKPSAFLDENGHEAKVAFAFDPAVIHLHPAEQLLVRVSAVIDSSLEPGVRYRGELSIPELQGTRVPAIVRRRPASPGTT